jgi:hypothetical protein
MTRNVRLFVALVGLASTVAAAQGVPTTVSFAANLKDATGPVTGQHTFLFSLYDGLTGGTQVWSENHSGVQVNQGFVSIALGTGSGTALTPTIFNGAALFLEVTLDGQLLSPRTAIQSVPYALRAGVANRAEALGTMLPGEVQRRVAGSCASGAITSIDADGGVTCLAVGTLTGVATSATSGLAGGATVGTPNLSLASCPTGQVLKSTGTGWSCQPDLNLATVVASGGLTGSVAGTQLTVSTDATVQRRTVAPTCAAGFLTAIAADGTPTCVNHSGGTGITVTGNSIALSPCPAGQVLKANTAGQMVCGEDTAGTVGGGLVGNGSAAAPLAVDFTGSTGTANSAARSDHTHGMTCVRRVGTGSSGTSFPNNDQVGCLAGEVMTGGGCTSNAALIENQQYQCNGIFCFCFTGNFCRGVGNWVCGATGATSVVASAMCCKVN